MPNIHRHIEDGATADPHQLVLGVWRTLEMESPDRTLLERQSVIVLHESAVNPKLGKLCSDCTSR